MQIKDDYLTHGPSSLTEIFSFNHLLSTNSSDQKSLMNVELFPHFVWFQSEATSRDTTSIIWFFSWFSMNINILIEQKLIHLVTNDTIILQKNRI